MKNKGFTLIELLSVIVLLSLLALLVVPKVLEQKEKKEKEILDSKKKVLYTDAERYIKENNEDDITPGQTFCIGVETLIDEGYISMDADDLKDETVKLTIDENGNFITSLSSNCSDAIVIGTYIDRTLNGAGPVLKNDMIPVIISNNGTVKKANIKEEWYNYSEKKWANAVVLVDDTNYEIGDTIPEEKIKAYYVWIPRYKYKLFSNNNESTIEITFENRNAPKLHGTQVGEYRSHPAFTYGNKELSGFWVGKFETSVETTDPCYTTSNITNCNKELANPRVKPNVLSLRNQQVVNEYKTSKKISTNSGMIKNDEWGAVAYLSHSIYGINKQVRINNNNTYKTGCGADEDNKEGASTCDIEYGNATDYPQSTTGNITGIFDMSGGAYEYVMAVRADSDGLPMSGGSSSGNSGFNGIFGYQSNSDSPIELTTGTNFPDSKDYNLFDNPSDRDNITYYNGCNGEPCYGHSMSEIVKRAGSWYNDEHFISNKHYPWIYRSCGYYEKTKTGVFAFNNGTGEAYSYASFRVVVR